MSEEKKFEFTDRRYFRDTPFHMLMKNRLMNVLLVCSVYDAFMLEEDGRIDEQIFNEYTALNLRYPPLIIKASTAEQAFEHLNTRYFDLVITMLNIGETDAFELAKSIKTKYPNKPIVVLTHFSREVSLKLQHEDLSSIDYVFSWLGNADIMLAVIKLMEDRLNIEQDIQQVGVQSIILVEDSIRYYSSYLPALYKVLFQQARGLMGEGLNEHQKTLRMRGRPKILLATNYEEAITLYNKFEKNILGVISDVTYAKDGVKDPIAGIKLSEYIREKDNDIPILLQSSNIEHEEKAHALKTGFIFKHSKNLLNELRDYINYNFGFGDFIFRIPETGEEAGRAHDLVSFQHQLAEIPIESLLYHGSQDHFSTWLRNRAFFSLSNLYKPVKNHHFSDPEELRKYLVQNIRHYRRTKSRGIIAKFYRHRHDDLTSFSRIGEGSLGGKARGLAFLNFILKKNRLNYKYDDVTITIPQTVVIATDLFAEFMKDNGLYKVALSNVEDKEVLDRFLQARLPNHLIEDLKVFLEVIKKPVAVRSSSLLEDSHYQPFAGVYSTYMIPNNGSNLFIRLRELCQAIKCVYASTFYKNSKSYMHVTSNLIDEEKMGIILQEVTGAEYENTFYPTFSGVARSINFYPVFDEKAEDGIVNVAAGLGRTIVEGEKALRFSPKHPKKVLQLTTIESTLKNTQTHFYAVDMDQKEFIPTLDDGDNLKNMKVQDAMSHHSFSLIGSTYDAQNDMVRDDVSRPGRKLITFSNVLKHNMFPLAEIISDLLKTIEKAMNKPIEMEFAVNLDTQEEPKIFNVLQVRPIVTGSEEEDIDLSDATEENSLILSNSTLGNGVVSDIRDFIYVKPESFDPAKTVEMAQRISHLNDQFVERRENYILCGPGRWGSRDHWLGIPVVWSQISAARLIIEAGLKDFFIEPSQGSHFFQNLTSFRVSYFTIFPFKKDGFYNTKLLDQLDAVYEDPFIRHVRFNTPLTVKSDGKSSKGAVYLPITPTAPNNI